MKKIYAVAGATSTFMGPGRPEFDPKNLPSFKDHLIESISETLKQGDYVFDEGVISSFMPGPFFQQGHLGAFLPAFVPSLLGKPCLSIDGACGSGGRALTHAIKTILSGEAEQVFVAGLEMQNTMKPLYVADVLAGASDYHAFRKEGDAFFFPSLFDRRAAAYIQKYGEAKTREEMALWSIAAIEKAAKFSKSQEYGNVRKDLAKEARAAPNPDRFLSCLNGLACSKITDGAASCVLTTQKGGVEIISWGEAEGNITKLPADATRLDMMAIAVKKALDRAGIKPSDLSYLEIHDCFAITALLAVEAIGFAPTGKGGEFLQNPGKLKINLTGGLIGFGHPTGATGVRQMADLIRYMDEGYGMMVNMGGDDKTLTAIVVKK